MPAPATLKPGTEVRVRAARVVADVAGRGGSLSRLLPQAGAGLADPRDAALLGALASGTVRAYLRLAKVVELALDRPLKSGQAELEAVLCVGLYQLSATRVPAHAAVAATVEAARVLCGAGPVSLVNAVLRRYQRDGAALEAAASADSQARFAHPAWLLERLRSEWPQDWSAIVAAGNAEPPLWLRVNLRRISRADYAGRLMQECGLEARASPHAPAALCLREPRDVDSLPGFAAGLVSVQDAAAQLAAPLLEPRPSQRVLDACAAPGGKTAHLLELCPQARVTALDADPVRLQQVGDNLARLGLAARLLVGDAGAPHAWWDGEPYDRILLDAPCTATGVIRRHPDIKLLRRASDVEALARAQSRLLAALWPLMAPGGRLVYSTCSVLRAENAEQIGRFLAHTQDARAVEPAGSWGRASEAGRQVLPGEDGMDGFYYSCLEKTTPSVSA